MKLLASGKLGACLLTASSIVAIEATAQDQDTGLHLGVNVTGTYSDNYLRLSDEMQAERPWLTKTDYVLDTGAFLEWRQKAGRQTAYANIDAGYRLHKNNSSFDRFLLGSAVGVDWRLAARCEGNGELSYDRTIGEFETLEDITENTLKSHNLSAALRCSGPGRSNIVAGASLAGSRNSADTRSINDSNTQSVRGGIGYRLGRGDYINLLIRRSWRQYENRFTEGGFEDRNRQTSYLLDVTKAIGPRMSFTGQAGLTKATELNSQREGFSGFSGRGTLNWNLAGRHKVSVSAYREIETATSLAASWIRQSGFSAGLTSNLGPRLTLNADVSYNRRLMRLRPEFEEVAGISLNSQDKQTTVRLGAGWKVGRSLNLFLDGRYGKRNSVLDRFDYSEKAVILGIRYAR